MTTEGTKHDAGKPRMDLLPPDALLAVADVLTHGAIKYGDRNWEKGMAWGRLEGALMRHLAAYQMGQDVDAESGKLHTAHMACCALMLLSLQLRSAGSDSRNRLKASLVMSDAAMEKLAAQIMAPGPIVEKTTRPFITNTPRHGEAQGSRLRAAMTAVDQQTKEGA